MYCCSAAGELLPPMTVYKSISGNFYDTWATGAPLGSVFSANKSGWFNMKEFETFFEKVFLKHLEGRIPKEEVKVLIGDNLGAHLSLTVMELCKEHHVRFIFLPSNSTHLTQPLDVAVFGPMKKQWRVELNKYKEYCLDHNIRNVTIPKDKFGGLLQGMQANNQINNAANIRAGFEACGIFPLDMDKVLSKLPPEENTRRLVQNEFDLQLTEELRRNRYGEPGKKNTRAKKANRLPPGTSYTVSAAPEPPVDQEVEEDIAVPGNTGTYL